MTIYEKLSKWKLLFLPFVLFGIYSCAGSMAPATSSSPELDKKAVTLVFPDLPIPPELEIQEKESVIIASPGYQGGLITLTGRLSPMAVKNYFLDALPERGWNFVSSLSAGKGLMAFSKEGNGQCLITYFRTSFGYTKVEIWMAEPLIESGGHSEPKHRY